MSVTTQLADFWNAVGAVLPLRGVGLVVLALMAYSLWKQRALARQSKQFEQISSRYQNAINVSLDAIVVADATGRIIDFNTAAERIFGYSRNTAIGANMTDLIVPEKYRAAHMAGMSRLLSTGETRMANRGRVKLDGRRSSGEVFPVEISLGMTEHPDGPIFTGYIRDITDQVKAQEALTAARDEALAAVSAKSQFLAVMSHEMRTPLNGVLAVLDILSSGRLDEKQRRFVEAAINSGELLQRHIDDLLQLNELENRRLNFHRSTFCIRDLVEDVTAMNAAPSTANGNRLLFDSPIAELYIVEDRHRLSQILANLVSNAVKFTHDGQVEIAAHRVTGPNGEDLLEFFVTDNGAGIADEDKERIFETFVSIDPSYRQTSRGYGLGLAICRRVARAMGGEIGVESRKGEYSRFWVRLPFRPATPGATAAVFHASAARPFELPGGPLGLHVLLVEDDETNRLVAREMLTRFGCRVSEAEDGVQAVSAAEAGRFDLILMDVNMPNMGGLEATQRIRKSTWAASRLTPIVGVTAHALPEEQERLRRAGMQECLVKPVRARNLQGLLRRFTDFPAEFAGGDGREPATPDMAFVDPATVEDLMSLLPSHIFRARLEAFRVEVRALDVSLNAAIANGDMEQVAKLAHKSAGAAAIFGASRLREHLVRIDVSARSSPPNVARALIEDVSALCTLTNDAFEPFAQD